MEGHLVQRALVGGSEVPTLPLKVFTLSVNNDAGVIEAQIRANIRRQHTLLRTREERSEPLAIVAGGPSMKGYVSLIKQSGFPILAVNGAYNFLLKQGVVPEYFMMMDSRRDNLVHAKDLHPDTEAILSSQVHPTIFEYLDDRKVTMYHSYVDTAKRALADAWARYEEIPFVRAPVGAAGIHALYIAHILGFRNLKLFGYDFSYEGTEHHAFEQKMNDGEQTLQVLLGGKAYKTSGVLAFAASEFPRIAANMIRYHGAEIEIHGEGLLPAYMEHVNKEGEIPLELRERAKYEQIWEMDQYRKVSPGLRYVDEALQKLQMPLGSSIVDFGCGTGRVVKWFADLGFKAVGVDIAANCVEEPIDFVQAALWDADKLPKVEYGFSADVLEHIPPERVFDVLQAMHDSVSEACYLNIDTIDDSYGAFINRHLHMTIMEAKEWDVAMRKVWKNVECFPGKDEVTFVCRRD